MKIQYRRVFPSGAWELSCIVGTRYLHQQYMGYTKREATAEFREWVRQEAQS